jgi:hypothetical protein
MPVTDGYGPMQRWERDRGEAGTVEVVLQRVADGEALKEICKSRGWPYALVAQWLHGDEKLLARYDAALAIWVDGLAAQTIAIADGAGPDEVAAAALQIKTRQWAAEKLNRARYGQTLKVERSGGSAAVDGALLGLAGELLAKVRELPAKQERVIEAVTVVSTSEII